MPGRDTRPSKYTGHSPSFAGRTPRRHSTAWRFAPGQTALQTGCSPFQGSTTESSSFHFLVLPVVVLSVFLSFVKPILQDTASLPIPQAVLYPLLLFLVAWVFAIDLFAYGINTVHRTGLRQAIPSGRPYATSPSLRPLVLLKNGLMTFRFLPLLLIWGLLLVSLFA